MPSKTLPPVKDVIAKVRELAAEKPDFVYESPSGVRGCCVNWVEEDGKKIGSCLIGQALFALGAGDIISDMAGVDELYDYGDEDIGLEVDWLTVVQSAQDNKRPWGQAIEIADSRHRPLIAR